MPTLDFFNPVISHLGKIRCLALSVGLVKTGRGLFDVFEHMLHLVDLDVHAVLTDATGPTPRDEEKVQSSGKRSRDLLDSGYFRWGKSPCSTLWTLNIHYLLKLIGPLKRSTYHSEPYPQSSCGTNRFAESIFTPSENSRILSGSYVPDKEYDILDIIKPPFDSPHIEDFEIYVLQFYFLSNRAIKGVSSA
jgi:hypothetical protein